jgi:hypothetical protein
MDQADHLRTKPTTSGLTIDLPNVQTKPTTSGLTIDLPNVRGERGKA